MGKEVAIEAEVGITKRPATITATAAVATMATTTTTIPTTTAAIATITVATTSGAATTIARTTVLRASRLAIAVVAAHAIVPIGHNNAEPQRWHRHIQARPDDGHTHV